MVVLTLSWLGPNIVLVTRVKYNFHNVFIIEFGHGFRNVFITRIGVGFCIVFVTFSWLGSHMFFLTESRYTFMIVSWPGVGLCFRDQSFRISPKWPRCLPHNHRKVQVSFPSKSPQKLLKEPPPTEFCS